MVRLFLFEIVTEVNMRKNVVAMLLLLFLASCSNTPMESGRAEQMLAAFHSAWEKGNVDDMLSLYDSSFLVSQGRDAWRKKLVAYSSRLGRLKTIRQSSSQVDARFSGDYYIYQFRLGFEGGVLRETITLYTKLNQDKMLIVGHVLKSSSSSNH